MDSSLIHSAYKASLQSLAKGELRSAFEKTRVLVDQLQMGIYTDKLNEFEQNYKYLLQYFVAGVDDAERKVVYKKIVAKVVLLNFELNELLQLQNNSSFEYTQKRYFPHIKKFSSPDELYRSLIYFHNQSSLFIADKEISHTVELNRLRANYEDLLPRLFGLYWLNTTISPDEKALFEQILNGSYPGQNEKSLLISALTLNLWRMFDDQKLMMLFDCCNHKDIQLRQRALVGLSFVLAKYDMFLPFFPAIRNRMVLLADDDQIVQNFQNIFIQIIATSETEKISKKLREEILPEVMKVSPLLKDKLDAESLLNKDEWDEENPAWQEIIEKSGVSDKLQELSELQLEGADVYMSTFAMLKNFPFFSNLAAWLMPFDAKHSAVNDLFKTDDKTVLTAFVSSSAMCNSDKYSFCLSILQMPETQRNIIKQSFNMESTQLEEMTKDEALLNPNLAAKNISKQYIQDLFRIFKLHPQHKEFSDMFGYSLKMHKCNLFDILSSNANFKLSIASYYFTKSHYTQALALYLELNSESEPSAAICQKIGYCYQQNSQINEALESYLKAEIIQPDDVWTVRKIALCYKLAGNFHKALEYYLHADHLKPNSSAIQMSIGHCYIELGRHKEALKLYYKLDAENGENTKVWRAITWCALVSKNIHKADYYSQKLISSEPTAYDFLNAGHIAWCQKRVGDAVDFYRQSLLKLDNNWALYSEIFLEDKSHLAANGIDVSEIPLMLDAVKTDSPNPIQ